MMQTGMTKILSLVLAFCLCIAMLPTVTLQANAASNIVINGVDIGYAHGSYFTKNGASCKDNNNYHNDGTPKATCHNRRGYDCVRTTDPSCNCMRYWPTGSASTCQVDLKSSQCYGFAMYCQWKVYGTFDVQNASAFENVSGNISSSECTGDNLKQKLMNCAPATHVRTSSSQKGWAHSISIISTSDAGVNFTDCNSDGCCKVRNVSMSWSEFAEYMKTYGGIVYANSYKNAAPTHPTHTYSGSYHEEVHPHKVYQKCSCGATQYTGSTTTVSSCAACNPVNVTDKYNPVLSFKGYLKGTSKVYPYSTPQMTSKSGGEIWASDECTITKVYTNGACEVNYPAGTKTKTAYTYLSDFVGNTSASLERHTMTRKVTTYIRASTDSAQYGYADSGDVIYKLGTSGNMTQIFYPTSSGYKLAWILTSDLTEPTYDTRFNPYAPIKGYPCATATFNVYSADHRTDIGDIWVSDYCTITAIYADGWCYVTYPTSKGDKQGYTQLSNFVYDISASHVKYTANAQIKVHKNKNLPGDLNWYISSGDQFFTVGSYGDSTQVLYPIDAQYGGGYKLGWIRTGDLPKTTYTVSYNANGGSGAPSSQTKTHGKALTLTTAVPTRSGYAFVGWATSASATSAVYMPGASYTNDASVTLYAVWTLNKYEISYNANGGTGAPAAQSKGHGTNLTLSMTVPTKQYTVTYNANGGHSDVSSRQIGCKFLGWATTSSATTAAYQPGGLFTDNANTMLYAVWQNSAMGTCPVPVRQGYVFDGWYTAASGGTLVSASSIISNHMTVYAHWTQSSYSITYDANGGVGAPPNQTKTHGKDITLSSVIPTRTGYSFMGWAMDEKPDTVQYQPGAVYSVDNDLMLIAVWQQAVLSDIRVLNAPNKTTYYVGDKLDPAGLKLEATYSDGSTKIISEGFSCTPERLSTVGTQTITVSYGGKTAAFSVTVKALPNGMMSVGRESGAPGDTVTVAIKLESNPGIVAARLKIAYNSNLLTLTGVRDGGILGEAEFGPNLNANPYIVTWENALAETDYTATGALVYLTFRIAENAPAGEVPITVSYDLEEIYNKDQTNVAFTIDQGAVTVEEVEYIDPDAAQIVVSEATAKAGGCVNITISLVNNPGIASMMLQVGYDSDVLTLVKVTDGNNLGTAVHSDNYASCPYTLTWANDLATQNYTYNGKIVTLTFEVAEDAQEGTTPVTVYYDYDNFDIFNVEGEEVWFEPVDGSVNITDVLVGDVNSDGKVNTQDRMILTRYLAKWTDYPEGSIDPVAADVNCDGKVNTQDRMLLTRYLAKWSGYEELPCS